MLPLRNLLRAQITNVSRSSVSWGPHLFIRSSSTVSIDDQIDCWNCHHRHNYDLFCPACRSVQCTNCTSKKLNYFQVMKNDINFDVSLDKLKPYYIKLQSMLHPDRYATRTDMEQDYSTTQSALVNLAFKTLSDPLKRGLYMLNLFGYALDSEKIESSDTELLNEIFMTNFEVDECEYRDELVQLQEQVNELIETEKIEISEAFRGAEFVRAREALIRLKYRTNIQKKIEDKLFNLS